MTNTKRTMSQRAVKIARVERRKGPKNRKKIEKLKKLGLLFEA